MSLPHTLTPLDVKFTMLALYWKYNRLKSIGSKTSTDHMMEGLKTLHIYIQILDYYYANNHQEILVTEDDIWELYEKIKQVFLYVKPTYHVGSNKSPLV